MVIYKHIHISHAPGGTLTLLAAIALLLNDSFSPGGGGGGERVLGVTVSLSRIK